MQQTDLKTSPSGVQVDSALDHKQRASSFGRDPQHSKGINRLRQIIGGLSIRKKIGLGYTLSLAIAVLGTTSGLLIGAQSQKHGIQRIIEANQHEELLSNLRIATLEVPLYWQKLNDLPNPSSAQFQLDKSQWLKGINTLKAELSELQSSQATIEGLELLLNEYDGVIANYLRELDILLRQMSPLSQKPADIISAKKLLLSFADRPAVQKFNRFCETLQPLIVKAQEQQTQAAQALSQGANVRLLIVMSSLLLSIVIASGLAIYTSQAIARPLEAVTRVTQQVTQHANFDLKAPVLTQDEIGILAISFNQLIHRVQQLLTDLEDQQESQLFQNEKMASLGRMLAEVAHEINNPINCIYGNIEPAQEHIKDILSLLDIYLSEIAKPPPAVTALAQEIDLDFVKEDLPKTLCSIKVGAERAKSIVMTLKTFSRMDDNAPTSLDLHECIDSSLLILRNRIKNNIQVLCNYGNIPQIEGYMGLLYQVFMNIISNAVDALLDKKVNPENLKIVITTERLDSEWVVVRIADNGPGIEPENNDKIFETFFTTKPRGIGTGLGLAISRQIVEDKHGGKLTCKSEGGQGTEFAIALPIKHFSGNTTSQLPLVRAST